MWATRILDKIVQINEQNLPIVINWMQEYGHTMNVIIVENDEYAGDLLKLFYHLAMSEVGDFLDMVNTIISMIFSNDLDPPVTKVTNKNIYIVVLKKIRGDVIKRILQKRENKNCLKVSPDHQSRKIIRLGKITTKVEMTKINKSRGRKIGRIN